MIKLRASRNISPMMAKGSFHLVCYKIALRLNIDSSGEPALNQSCAGDYELTVSCSHVSLPTVNQIRRLQLKSVLI